MDKKKDNPSRQRAKFVEAAELHRWKAGELAVRKPFE
jgi:hypothetical protein